MKQKRRLSRGCTNKVFHSIFSHSERRKIIWALNLKPGDVISSLLGYNSIVKKTTVIWNPVDLLTKGRLPIRGRKGQAITCIKIELFGNPVEWTIFSRNSLFGPPNSVEKIKMSKSAKELYFFTEMTDLINEKMQWRRGITWEELLIYQEIIKESNERRQ